MIPLTEYNIPTLLYLQNDYLTPLKLHLPSLGQKCIVLTGKTSHVKTNTLQPTLKLLKELNIEFYHSDIITPNPTHEQIHTAAKASPFKPDFIIGIGGGSVLDAAKALAFAVNGVDNLGQKTQIAPIKLAGICLASGTGSEVTQYSILTQHNIKSSIPNFAFFDVCVVPFSLQASLPENQLKSTHWDIFCHATEAALNIKTTPEVRATSMKALELLKINDLYSKALAAIYAGISIAKAGTSVPHGLSYAITTFKGLSHGAACAVFSCDWLEMFQKEGKKEIIEAYFGEYNIQKLRKAIVTDVGEKPKLTIDEAQMYAEQLIKSGKLAAHFEKISYEQVVDLYLK
ncbi:alcohol dehydrogenase [Spironucleus salmonicida]|uniref:Alcohol dehydrogenase n=1 Tax=Spironucleus salmonicida TaxID=348837 RepID=V6LM69_9EUKA|nr:alcohol dehydrogenase [Spironucleus salmonicida]|eukprot:EST45740.1 Alcohol dehydrogenase [Spironucleus salmonicida]